MNSGQDQKVSQQNINVSSYLKQKKKKKAILIIVFNTFNTVRVAFSKCTKYLGTGIHNSKIFPELWNKLNKILKYYFI